MTTLLGRLTATIDGASVDIVDAATIAEYSVQADGFTLGAAIENPLYSSSVQQGIVRVIGAAKGQREIRIPLLVTGADKAAVLASVDALVAVCDSVSRFGGGEYLHRASGASLPVRFRVASALVGGVDSWGEFEAHSRARVSVSIVADTFARGAVYSVDDDFSTDTVGVGGVYNIGGSDWTTSTAASANAPTVSGGVLTVEPLTTTADILHTGNGNVYGDVEVSAKINLTTLDANKIAGLVVKSVSISSLVSARVMALSNGAGAGTLYAQIYTVGGSTDNSTKAITTLTAGVDYWIVGRIVGGSFTVEFWDSEPTPTGTPTHEKTLEIASNATPEMSGDVLGYAGLRFRDIDSGGIDYDDFKVRPLTYTGVTFPEVLALNGAWGGTTDAQAAVIYTNASGGTAPTRMLYAWWGAVWEQPNMVSNGHFERDTSGWSIAAQGGLNAASTSIDRVTTDARTGAACAEIVTPATSLSGVNFAVYGKFKKGRTYTATCWARSDSDTTGLQSRLGNSSSDVANNTQIVLTTSWALHTVTWTPTADYGVAYFAIRVTTAVATNFQIDDVQVYEGTTAPTFAAGAHGPNIIDAASADEETLGSAFTITADADYLNGYGVQSSGDLSTNGTLEYFLRPDLFPPNEYGCGEVDIAVYARVEIASTQSDVNCVLSIGPEGDSAHTLANQKYSEFYDDGKNLQEPVTSTTFQPVYLGTVTARVDRANPSRWKLRLAFVNNPASTGTLGVDYLVCVPAKNIASSQTGATDANVPAFIATTTPTTKRVNSDLSAVVSDPASQLGGGAIPDRGLLRNHIRIPKDGANLLVWPSDMQIDYPAVNSLSMAETFTGTVHVEIQPLHHVTKV